MKSLKKLSSLVIASFFALLAFSAIADEVVESELVSQSLLCELLPFMCGVSTLGNGDGEIPPKPPKN